MRSAYLFQIMGGVALMAIAMPAAAQEAGQQPSTAAPAQQADHKSAEVQNPDSSSVRDIIVTANKRTERLQDVPVAVTVVGADQVAQQNIVDVGGLTRTAPALTSQSQGASAVLEIRGIGALSFSRTTEGSVGIVVDGVPLANANAGSPQLFDVDRVEVLEGPQGTLFGRNSSAGVINITTNAPDPTKVEVIGHAEVGTRDSAIAQAAVNLPVANNAAFRITGSYNRLAHSIYNIPNDSWDDQQASSLRGRFKWTPTSAITINLIGDYGKTTVDGGAGWTVYESTPGSPLTALLNACGVTPSRQNHKACIDGPNGAFSESYGFSGEVDADLGGPVLTSISAYRSYRNGGPGGDSDSVPINILNTNASTSNIRNFSEELRLASPTGHFLDYVVGLYYFDSAQDYAGTQSGQVEQLLGIPFLLGQSFATRASSTSYAAFGQATLHFTDRFRGIAGLRYGHESVTANTMRSLAPGAVAPFGSIAPVAGSTDDTYFSFRGGLQFDITHNIMAYATYTRGYKGPALNDQGDPSTPFIVKPEIPYASEIGVKSTLLNGNLGVNLAAFRTVVHNFQSQFFDAAILGYAYGNAPRLVTQGIEANIFGRPVHNLTLNIGALYNDAHYGHGYLVACGQLETAAQGCMPVLGPGGVVIGTVDDAGGNRLVGAPEWKFTGNAEYSHALSSSLQGFVQTDIVYSSRVYSNQAYDPDASIAPNTLIGARLGVRASNGRWSIAGYVRNLLDERVPTATNPNPTGALTGDPHSYMQLLGAESFRTIGIAVSFKW